MENFTYPVTLLPRTADTINGGYTTTFWITDLLNHNLPERKIEAGSVDELLAKIETFATEHGEPCEASVSFPRAPGRRKPRGFEQRTRRLYFNH